jgi:hypothetical protein
MKQMRVTLPIFAGLSAALYLVATEPLPGARKQ